MVIRHCIRILVLITFLDSTAYAQLSWNVLGNLATPRCDGFAFYLGNGEIIVLGGSSTQITDRTALASCEIIDLNTRTVKPGSSMNSPHMDFEALLTPDSNIIAIGGLSGTDANGAMTASVELYDRSKRTWRVIGFLPKPRRQHRAIFLDDHEILIAGGRLQDQVTTADAEIFDMTTGTSKSIAPLPFAMNYGVIGYTSSGVLVAFGGRNGGANSYRERNVYRYDGSLDKWILDGQLNEAIIAPSLLKLRNGQLLAIGGSRGESPPNYVRDVQIERSGQWSVIAQTMIERDVRTALQWNSDSILVIGGRNNAYQSLATTEWLTLSNGIPSAAPTMNGPHARHMMVTIATPGDSFPSTVVVISGEKSGTEMTGLVEILRRPGCDPSQQAEIMTPLHNGEMVFRQIEPGETVCDSLVLHNRSATPYIIASARMLHQIGFHLELDQFPIVIPPGEERSLRICFIPSGSESTRDTLLLGDACPLHVPLVVTDRLMAVPYDGALDISEYMRTHPNPASAELEVVFGLAHAGLIRMEVFSIDGRAMFTPFDAVCGIGEHRQRIDLSALPAGEYLLRLCTPLHTMTRWFAVDR